MSSCPICRKVFAAATFCPQDGSRLVDEKMDGSVVLDDRYRLLRKVGAGGMGEVYEAEHIHIHRKVAVKVLKPEIASDAEAIERLKREAQTTTGLDHPNIVDTFDFGHAEGQAYLVMEWLDGESLDQRLERGPIDLVTAIEIAAQAAAGLAEAHDHGVIHRDVKPANLFLTTDRRGVLVVKIVDFGIAKLASQLALTATGVLIGTPSYMAPEQALGEPIDGRTDVYALGVILYEMVTGTPPFRGDSPLAVLHQHTSKVPMPPSESAADRGITVEVEAVILRCLAKRPADRFASMAELARALDEIRGVAPVAIPAAEASQAAVRADVQPPTELPPPMPRRPSGLWVGLAVVAVIAAGAVAFVITSRKHEPTAGSGSQPAATIGGATADAMPTPDAAPLAIPDAAVAAALPDPLLLLEEIDQGVTDCTKHMLKMDLVEQLERSLANRPAIAKKDLDALKLQAGKFLEACKEADGNDVRFHRGNIRALTTAIRNLL